MVLGAEFHGWNGGFQASDLESSSLGLNPGMSPPLSRSSPFLSPPYVVTSAPQPTTRSLEIKDTVISFILDYLIWVYNRDGLNRLGIGTAACVASRHSEAHLAAEHFKPTIPPFVAKF